MRYLSDMKNVAERELITKFRRSNKVRLICSDVSSRLSFKRQQSSKPTAKIRKMQRNAVHDLDDRHGTKEINRGNVGDDDEICDNTNYRKKETKNKRKWIESCKRRDKEENSIGSILNRKDQYKVSNISLIVWRLLPTIRTRQRNSENLLSPMNKWQLWIKKFYCIFTRVEKKENFHKKFSKNFPKIFQKFFQKNIFLAPDEPLVSLGLFLEVLCGSTEAFCSPMWSYVVLCGPMWSYVVLCDD